MVGRLSASAAGRAAILVGWFVAAGGVLAPAAYLVRGPVGLMGVGAAWAVCLVSGLLALLPAELFRHPDLAVPRVLLGMFPRMGLPLAACMLVYLRKGMLAESGFVYYIIAFYFVTLAVETVLLAGHLSAKPKETHAG